VIADFLIPHFRDSVHGSVSLFFSVRFHLFGTVRFLLFVLVGFLPIVVIWGLLRGGDLLSAVAGSP
jgi:hypothetical protein